MKTSERIGDLLGLLRAAQSDYDIARERVSDADKQIQDILHWLENNEAPPVDGDGEMLILAAIGIARRDRRNAKDAVTVMRPVVEWAAGHKSAVNSLEKLLGEVRKAERDTENRHYTDRTDIMKEILGSEE